MSGLQDPDPCPESQWPTIDVWDVVVFWNSEMSWQSAVNSLEFFYFSFFYFIYVSLFLYIFTSQLHMSFRITGMWIRKKQLQIIYCIGYIFGLFGLLFSSLNLCLHIIFTQLYVLIFFIYVHFTMEKKSLVSQIYDQLNVFKCQTSKLWEFVLVSRPQSPQHRAIDPQQY